MGRRSFFFLLGCLSLFFCPFFLREIGVDVFLLLFLEFRLDGLVGYLCILFTIHPPTVKL